MKYNKRRPFDDDNKIGHMESDRDYVLNNLDLCVKYLDSLLVGTGYVAVYEQEDALYVINEQGVVERTDKKIAQWWITKKDFWEENGYINDRYLRLKIKDFEQDQEACYTYRPDWPCDNVKKQAKLLEEMGFEVILDHEGW